MKTMGPLEVDKYYLSTYTQCTHKQCTVKLIQNGTIKRTVQYNHCEVTLHVEGARVNSSRLGTRISSILPSIFITRCGSVHLNNRQEKNAQSWPTISTISIHTQDQDILLNYSTNIFPFTHSFEQPPYPCQKPFDYDILIGHKMA